MRRMMFALLCCGLVLPGEALADTDSAAEAHSELEAKKAENAADESASEAVEAAPVAVPEPVAEPEPEPEPAPAPPPPAAKPPAVSEKISKLNVGGQVVFALAAQLDVLKGAKDAVDINALVAKARLAGAFSIVGGSWLDVDAARRQSDAVKAALVEIGDKLKPLADIDPTDGAKVSGKKKELLAAFPSIEKLVAAAAVGTTKTKLDEGLALFKMALDPPYAYGQSSKKIAGWSAASVGAMIAMAGLASLTNPLEREQGSFGWVATGIGLTTAGVGAALIVLDAK